MSSVSHVLDEFCRLPSSKQSRSASQIIQLPKHVIRTLNPTPLSFLWKTFLKHFIVFLEDSFFQIIHHLKWCLFYSRLLSRGKSISPNIIKTKWHYMWSNNRIQTGFNTSHLCWLEKTSSKKIQCHCEEFVVI